MADSVISLLPALGAEVAAADLMVIVDVSDTSQAAAGTNKVVTATEALRTHGSTKHTGNVFPATNTTAQVLGAAELTQKNMSEPGNPDAGVVTRYIVDDNGVFLPETKSPTGLRLREGRDRYVLVKNGSGSTISKGEAVYISGTDAGAFNIAKARSDSSTTMPVAGVLAQTINNTQFGLMITGGILSGFDTSGYAAGATLYVSPSVAGEITSTVPTAPNYPVAFGKCLTSHASTGIIYITIGSAVAATSGVGASNIGAGTGTLFKGTSGNDLVFKTLIEGGGIALTNGTDEVTLAVNPVYTQCFS